MCKGREGICCFGCSTKLGIHLITMLVAAEICILAYLFKYEIAEGIFNLKVFTWLALSVARLVSYFTMCCDSISKRLCFFWVLVGTTVLEACMFTIMNVGLFDESSTEVVLKIAESWGMGSGLQIALVEILSLSHLVMFCYFSAIAHEYYTMGRDDPAMIDAEHKRLAAEEKKAAADR